jgi:multiple sugar transport system permease protein
MLHRKRTPFGTFVMYALLLLWTFIVLFPFYWMVTTSFKRPLDVNRVPRYIPFVDFQPVLDHWEFILITQNEQVMRQLRNSVIAASGSALIVTVVGAMAGYGLSRFRYQWRFPRWNNTNIAYWIISQRFLPPASLIIPFLLLYGTAGLIDTHIGLILAYTSFNIPFAVWIMREFFNSLPIDLEESARVDGASRVVTFLRIVLPLSAPGIVTAALFSFVFAWNEYLFALMLTNNDAITMPVYIAGQNSTRGTEWWYISALTLLSVAPVLLLGLFLQRYITRGLVAGALKG